MSLTDQIDQAIRAGKSIDDLDIPPERLADAQEYARRQTLKLRGEDPDLEATTGAGAKARRDYSREVSDFTDEEYLAAQLPANAGIKPAPAMGFETGRVMTRYENARDGFRVLKDKGVIPPDATQKAVETRNGELVYGYQLPDDPTFYRLTPDSLLESPMSAVGSLAAQPLEVAGGIAGSLVGGPGPRILKEMVGAAGGRLADELVERQQGGTQESVPSMLGEAGESALWAGAGSLAYSGAKLGKNLIGTPGRPTELEGLKEAAKTVSEAGTTPPYQPTLADMEGATPQIKRIVAMYNKIYGAGDKNKLKATEGSRKALESMLNDAAERGQLPVTAEGSLDWDNLVTQVDNDKLYTVIVGMRDSLVQDTKQKLSREAGLNVGEEALANAARYQAGVEQYSNAMDAAVSKYYDEAFELAGQYNAVSGGRPVEFQLDKLKGVLSEVKKTEVVGADGELRPWQISDLSPGLKQTLSQFEDLANNQSWRSQPITEAPPPGTSMLGMKAKRSVERRYRAANEVLDSLKTIRSQLGDLSKPDKDTGAHTISSRIAAKMYGALSEAIKNPAYGTKEFQEAWTKANAAHADHMNVLSYLDAGSLMDKARLDGPEAITRDLYSRIASDTGSPLTLIKTLERVLDPETVATVKSGYVDKLLSNPNALARKEWSEAEKKLLSDDARKILRFHGMRMSKIGKDDLAKALGDQLDKQAMVRQLVTKTPPNRLKQTLDAAGIPKELAQATVFSDILAQVTREQNKKLFVNPSAFNTYIRGLKSERKSDLWKILSPTQKKVLRDVDTLTSFIQRGEGIAIGLEANQILAKRAKLLNPVTASVGYAQSWWYGTLGYLASNPAVVEVVDRAGGISKFNVNKYAKSTAIATTLAAKNLLASPEVQERKQ